MRPPSYFIALCAGAKGHSRVRVRRKNDFIPKPLSSVHRLAIGLKMNRNWKGSGCSAWALIVPIKRLLGGRCVKRTGSFLRRNNGVKLASPVLIAAIVMALVNGALAQFGRTPDEFRPGCVQIVNQTGLPLIVSVGGDGWESGDHWPVKTAETQWLLLNRGRTPGQPNRLLVVDDETMVWASKAVVVGNVWTPNPNTTPKRFVKNDPNAKYTKLHNPNCYDASKQPYEWSWRILFH